MNERDRLASPPRYASMSSDSVQIEENVTLAEDKGKLTRVTFRQRRRDGSWQRRKREIYDNGNSAVILPYDPERKTVLLTRQLRLPVYLQDRVTGSIEACAGKLDGEAAAKRIVKEMEEELGYRIEKVKRLFELYVSPASVAEKITFFTCNYSPADKVSAGGGLADEGEDIEVLETTLERASEMIASGEIIDAKTVILIQYFGERGGQPAAGTPADAKR
jgi:nudix-type nucleoside diphosphatase (YffH/AdpP family)